MSSRLLYLELFSINFALFLREEAQLIVEIPLHEPEAFSAILVLPQRLHRHGARSESGSQLHQEMRETFGDGKEFVLEVWCPSY